MPVRCVICHTTGKPYKEYEELLMGMPAHFQKHHTEHAAEYRHYLEVYANGDWVPFKQTTVDAMSTEGIKVKPQPKGGQNGKA
jgi:hypothetical protein